MLPTQCGYWDGGHLGAASVGLHGSGSSEERCYAAAHHRGPRTSVVHSDEWTAYNCVAGLPGVADHATVNHSVEFVSPGGVHTQNVQSYWNRVKTKQKRMRGCHSHQLPLYLDEFMWRERFGKTAISAFQGIMADISLQYQ